MKELMKGYYDYLNEGTKLRQIGGWTEVTTTFLDSRNDCIGFYMKEDEEGNIEITDDAWTINNMYLDEDDVDKNRRIRNIAMSNGVTLDGNELIKITTREKFNLDVHFYLNCLIQISNL